MSFWDDGSSGNNNIVSIPAASAVRVYVYYAVSSRVCVCVWMRGGEIGTCLAFEMYIIR